MDNQTLGLIHLLRSALNDEVLTLPVDFNWDDAQSVIHQHYLVGLAIQGSARCSVPRSHPAVRQLMAAFCTDAQASRKQLQQLQTIYRLFNENNIAYLPIKGAVLKPLYLRPELRVMGDADILIRQEQYPLIRLILTSVGMQAIDENDYELTWQGNGLTVELHKSIVPHRDAAAFAYYGTGWDLARKDASGSGWHLSPEDHLIYQIVHFSKHYRDGSISVRNICDFWVCRKAYPDMDQTYIETELDKLGLARFYRNLQALLDTWFLGAPATKTTELLTHTVFLGGILDPNESSVAYALTANTTETTSLSRNKAKWLLNKIFPSRQVMAYPYPAVGKYPFLLPVYWVVRWFELLFRKNQQAKHTLKAMQSVMGGGDGHLKEYHDHLDAVGLNFKDAL